MNIIVKCYHNNNNNNNNNNNKYRIDVYTDWTHETGRSVLSPVGWVFSSWRSLACDQWRVDRALWAPLLCDCPSLSALALRSSYMPTRTENRRPTAAPDHPDSRHKSISTLKNNSINEEWAPTPQTLEWIILEFANWSLACSLRYAGAFTNERTNLTCVVIAN